MKILLFFLMAAHTLIGQQTNPFELRQRMDLTSVPLDSISEMVQTPTQDAVRGDSLVLERNPFEIGRIRDEVQKTELSVSATGRTAASRVNALGILFSTISLILFAIGLLLNRARFYSMFRSVINSNYLKTLMRTTNVSSDLQLFVLYTMALINLALFVYLSIGTGRFELETSIGLGFFTILGIFFSAYLLRHFVLWFLDTIFPVGGSAVSYGYSVAFHNIAAGTVLLPFVLGLQFGPSEGFRWLVFGGLFCFGLIYLLRQFKGGLLALGIKGFNPMYFFLYLCAIEIAPILVGLKVLFNSL